MSKHIFTLFLLISFYVANAQPLTKTDSLREALKSSSGESAVEISISLAQSYLYTNPSEGLTEIIKVLEDSDITNYPKSHARALMVYGALLNVSGQYYKSLEVSQEAIVKAEAGRWKDLVCSAKLNMGTTYIRIGNYTRAAENHYEGAELAGEIGDSDLELTHLMNLGVLKIQLGSIDEARKHLNRALVVSRANNDRFRQAQVLGNLGYLEYVNQNIGTSSEHHKASLELFLALGDKVQTANAHNNLGFAYSLADKIDLAENQYRKSLAIYESLSDSNGIARVILNQARIEESKGNLRKALSLIEKVTQTSTSLGFNARLLEVFELQQNIYEQLGDYKNALAAYRNYVIIKDSIADQTNKAKIANLSARFDFDELSAQAELREKETEIQALRLKQRNQQIAALGIVLLILLVAFLWNRSVLRGKLNLSVQEKDLQSLEYQLEKQKLLKFTEELSAKNESLQHLVDQNDPISENAEDGADTNALMLEKLSTSLVDEKDWKKFNIYFDALYPAFYERLNQSASKKLTISEKRLAALVKLELTNKEIASILNISRNSVVKAKYRLRQHLQLNETKEMEDFLVNL